MEKATEPHEMVTESPYPYMFTMGEGDFYRSKQVLRLFMYVNESDLYKILETCRLRISCPWRTNDVTECVIQGETQQSEYVKTFGYLCFSATPHSPAMWGYYADRSRGACLFFDFEVMLLSDEQGDYYALLEDGGYDRFGLEIRPILYSRERTPDEASDKQRFQTHCFFRKCDDWKHEREYRILFKLDEDVHVEYAQEDGYKLPRFYDSRVIRSLSGIILGPHFPHQQVEVEKKLQWCADYLAKQGKEPSVELTGLMVSRAMFNRVTFEYESAAGMSPSELDWDDSHVWKILQTATWVKKDYSKIPSYFNHIPGVRHCVHNIYETQTIRGNVYYLVTRQGQSAEPYFDLFRYQEGKGTTLIIGIRQDYLHELYQGMNDQFS